MISADNLSKSYGAHVLFKNLSFKINSRERVGLVGRNGHGKTTLFRIIIGQEACDDGQLTIPKNYHVGHVQQHLKFTQSTVIEEGMLGLPPTEKDHHWKVEKILAGLGFLTADMKRRPDEFSGGFQVRLNLAKVLVSDPDLLLLDEPTNYLDITSIRWIERFLINWPRELMLITHDRSFMDRLVTHTMGIHRKGIRKIAGNTEKYYAQLAQDEEIHEKTRLNEERRTKEIEQFITRFRAKARLAGMVQSRIKTLSKIEKSSKLEQLQNLEFGFRSLEFKAKHVLSAKDLTFGYSEQSMLFKNLNLSVNSGDRICVVGPNGKGKTTLLKLLAGQFQPQQGEISYHPRVEKGFYEQTNVQSLNEHNSVEQEIQSSYPDVDRQMARNISGAMLFSGDSALKSISVLSGGEKARVMLGKLLVKPLNFLLLDEPSNHLDMESCDALLAAIDNFEGAVIMVTHNEMFLHALARRLIVFNADSVDMFEGSYQQFLDKGGWGDETDTATLKRKDDDKQTDDKTERFNKKQIRRRRSVIINERSRQLKPVERIITETELKIETEENRLEQLNQQMVEAVQDKKGNHIANLSQHIHQCQQQIDQNFNKLESLYQQKDALEKSFNAQLADLEDT
ncbi:MAG: ABC-F family ATP-binding cassette domain-containing protein [Desulfobacteraceae bacterium]|nr:ABC-F family ATP-binding cassette domain-containing protein [Desulfobacteraceae bacterium]